jgi:hypothetical protein
METAIQLAWWIGLIGALLATLAILKQLFNVLRVLRHILELSEMIRDSARQIEHNTEIIPKLEGALKPSADLRRSLKRTAFTITTLNRKIISENKTQEPANR